MEEYSVITLKFQENPRGRWGYIPNFSDYEYSVEEGESLSFWCYRLSEQPLEDIVKFAEYIGKFKDFTLIAHTDCSNSINAKKLIEIADEVYIDGQPIKLTKTTDTKETEMSKNMDMELRIPEDQMQRLEAIAANIQKSVGPKTLKQKMTGMLLGRVSILMVLAAYFFMGSEPPKVVSFDRANGIVSIQDGQNIQNLIWNGEQLSRNGEIFGGKFSDSISRSLLLGLDVIGLEDDSSWF